MLTKTIFAASMALISEIYDRELSKTLMSSYYSLLKEMEDSDFQQAVKRMLQERTVATLPKPAEVLAYSNVKKVEVAEVDPAETKAKEMIQAVETMNTILCTEAHRANMTVDDYLQDFSFSNISDDSKVILNNVSPFYNLKQLVMGIRQYQTAVDALNAFIRAINQNNNESLAIESKQMKIMIKKG